MQCPQRPRWSCGNVHALFWFLKKKDTIFFAERNLLPFRRGNLVNFIPTTIAEDTVHWTVPYDICLSKYSSVLYCIFRHSCEATCSCQRGRHGLPFLVLAPLPSHTNVKLPHKRKIAKFTVGWAIKCALPEPYFSLFKFQRTKGYLPLLSWPLQIPCLPSPESAYICLIPLPWFILIWSMKLVHNKRWCHAN